MRLCRETPLEGVGGGTPHPVRPGGALVDSVGGDRAGNDAAAVHHRIEFCAGGFFAAGIAVPVPRRELHPRCAGLSSP